MSREQGCVDVIIAARDAAATIGRAVASALAQPETAQVIVIDDASRDDTTVAARAADDGSGRLLLIRLDQNVGPAAARNEALDRSRSAWITVLDGDDTMLPGRLGKLLAQAEGAGLVADDLLVVDEGGTMPRPMFDPPVAEPLSLDASDFIAGNITHGARLRRDLGFIKPIVRRSLLDATGARFDPKLRLGEDYELYTRLLLHAATLRLIPVSGYVYTIRASSLSGSHGISELRAFRDSNLALERIPGITPAQRTMVRRHYRSVDCRLQWLVLIEAVKRRDVAAGLATFLRSPQVAMFLVRQLLGEVPRRLLGRRRELAA